MPFEQVKDAGEAFPYFIRVDVSEDTSREVCASNA